MTIAYSPYHLAWRHNPESKREGALLRYRFSDGCIGYADCFSWPEFGDDPLETQLRLLSRGKTTPLTARAGLYARLDADARRNKMNLFATVQIPPSHLLVPSLVTQGQLPEASHYKVKMGDNIEREILLLKTLMIAHPESLFRLDFNGKIDREAFETFLITMKPYHHQIDFCEDPFPFDREGWKRVQETYGVSLACDRGAPRALGAPEVAQVIIVKPAKQDEKMLQGGKQRYVVTSYLDHPIGQLASAYFAAKVAKGEPGGLISHTAYMPNPYSQRLKVDNQVLVPPKEGTGFGFDDLLEAQVWTDV